jgi:hypothetical protein
VSGRAGDLEELPARLAELRELIREAHGATKDLRGAIREAREFSEGLIKLVDTAADCARTAAYEAGEAQIAAFGAHLQRELNKQAHELNVAVGEARRHIVKQLTLTRLIPAEDGGVIAEVASNQFDAEVPVAGDPR